MARKLVFPDGVRLSTLDEIPGTKEVRAERWARIQAANITQGFVLKRAEGQRFAWYAEANIDAPRIWAVVRELCHALLDPEATLLFGGIDEEVRSLGSADVSRILNALGQYEYQLTHDGFVQFGVVSDGDEINEVFVAPTKHLKIWVNDEPRFRQIIESHGIPEADHLEFIDEYPRMTTMLPPERVVRDIDELASLLAAEIGVRPQSH